MSDWWQCVCILTILAGFFVVLAGYCIFGGKGQMIDILNPRMEDFARASGLPVTQMTDDELQDLFSDAMSNVHDMDTGITDFAKACVKALRGAA